MPLWVSESDCVTVPGCQLFSPLPCYCAPVLKWRRCHLADRYALRLWCCHSLTSSNVRAHTHILQAPRTEYVCLYSDIPSRGPEGPGLASELNFKCFLIYFFGFPLTVQIAITNFLALRTPLIHSFHFARRLRGGAHMHKWNIMYNCRVCFSFALFAQFFFALFSAGFPCFFLDCCLLVAKINEAIRAQSEFRIKAWRTRIANAIVRSRAPIAYRTSTDIYTYRR